MKNKINGALLTLLMLFATLYPSGQAYANGLPPKIMTYFEKEDLALQLAGSKNFLAMVYTKSLLAFSYGLHNVKLSKDQLSENDIYLKAVSQKSENDRSDYEKQNIARILGVADYKNYENMNNDFVQSIKLLKKEFEIINNISKSELTDVITLALSTDKFKNYFTKAMMSQRTQRCWDGWWECMELPLVLALTTCLAVAFCIAASFAAGFFDQTAILLSIMSTCTAGIIAMFKLDFEAYGYCGALFKTCYESLPPEPGNPLQPIPPSTN